MFQQTTEPSAPSASRQQRCTNFFNQHNIRDVECIFADISGYTRGKPMPATDQAFLFKYAAREIALKHGLNAVFMAKPIADSAGSSMHLHTNVLDARGQNIFSLPDGAESPCLGR